MDLSSIKKCPYCAEDIRREAIICKHCKMDLTNRPTQNISTSNNSTNGKNLSVGDGVRTGCGMFIVLPLLLIGGVVLFIMMLASC